ncbi:SHOCT domain-containing protein [Anaerolineae bacterium CFX7]|nr:SHOCT domain-containing protein [Anaerolineae bacterium CFX7]
MEIYLADLPVLAGCLVILLIILLILRGGLPIVVGAILFSSIGGLTENHLFGWVLGVVIGGFLGYLVAKNYGPVRFASQEVEFAKLPKEISEKINAVFSDAEKVMICCKTEYSRFFTEISAKIYVVTDQRVVRADVSHQGVVARLTGNGNYMIDTSSMFLRDIIQIRESNQKEDVRVYIEGHGGAMVCQFARKSNLWKQNSTSREFLDVLHSAESRAKHSRPTPSITEQLRDLKQLFDQGFISPEEYKKKREEIIQNL